MLQRRRVGQASQPLSQSQSQTQTPRLQTKRKKQRLSGWRGRAASECLSGHGHDLLRLPRHRLVQQHQHQRQKYSLLRSLPVVTAVQALAAAARVAEALQQLMMMPMMMPMRSRRRAAKAVPAPADLRAAAAWQRQA